MLTDMEKGFSLIELMTTLAILGVLTGIAAPNLGYWISDKRLEAIATNARSIVVKSRSKSIATGESARIEFSSNSLTACITSDITKACNTRPADDVLSELSWDSAQVDVGRNSTLDTPIIIDPRGRIKPAQSVIVITFCDKRGANHGLILDINQVGRTNLGEMSNTEDPQCL